ncbi:hypothetical protein [Allokutzneria oryzae]|uniref:Uncharacterized protein n=1 Tax=Allokutzneria oryzae TaxID=1378989 RepID=A0ABV6A1W4_9PSEU
MDSGQGPAQRHRPQRGRHRQAADALAWTPDATGTGAAGLDAAPAADPLDDTNTGGLRKLDLGMVPASVTPPPTWKRAAWFSGLSSAIVLVVLVTVAVTLVGPKDVIDRINALPAYPSELMLATTTTTPARQTETSGRAAVRPTGTQDATGGDAEGVGGSGGPRRTAGRSPENNTSASSTPTTTSSMTTPPVTTVPSFGPELIPVRQLTESTVKFFSTVSSDVQQAFESLTSPELKKEGLPSFEKRFTKLEDTVEFKAMRVDPVRGVTTSVIEIKDKDGTVVVQERELRFLPNAAPLVDAERLVSTVQR